MIHFDTRLVNNSTFALALSGGVDSIAIAHFLKSGHKKFHAIHVNAKYIAQDDLAEQRVREFCAQFDIPLQVCTVTEKYISGSVEAFCRHTRYACLDAACARLQVHKLCVCHHLDDCVESYLMHCFQGHADRVPIPLQTDRGHIMVVRPFLQTSKAQLYRYAMSKGLLKYVTTDELNSDISLNRNWIRCELRPNIESRYPGLNKIVKKQIVKFSQKLLKCPEKLNSISA